MSSPNSPKVDHEEHLIPIVSPEEERKRKEHPNSRNSAARKRLRFGDSAPQEQDSTQEGGWKESTDVNEAPEESEQNSNDGTSLRSSSPTDEGEDEQEQQEQEDTTVESGACQSIVIRPRLKPGWCESRSVNGTCYCFQARLEQNCQSCHARINLLDCIMNQGCGWVHVRCETDEGREDCQTLYNNFIPLSVDRRLQLEGETRPELLESSDAQQESSDTNEESSDMSEESSDAVEESIIPILEKFEEEEKESDEAFGLTEEQKMIMNHRAAPGDIVRILARAGTGKTTTVAFLSHELLTRDSSQKILYVVFGNNAMTSARRSGKFPKNNMTILTSHALALRELQIPFQKVKSDYSRKTVADLLDLEALVNERFSRLKAKSKKRRRMAIAGYVIKTVEKFQQSSDSRVTTAHVFWKAKTDTELTKWRSQVRPSEYARWAQTLFDHVWDKCTDGRASHSGINITHDGYLKVLQLLIKQGQVKLSYDIIIVDEAQDLTPCQASVLWGDSTREESIIYIVGDNRQRLYRFRGARDSFDGANVAKELHLTGSFRFGEGIARIANLVLGQDGSRDIVRGLAKNNGKVRKLAEFKSGVVICRTNNGMYQFLQAFQPRRWTFVSPERSPKPLRFAKDLESLRSFITGEKAKYKLDDEEFDSVRELKQYCEEADKHDMLNNIDLVCHYAEHGTNISELYAQLGRTFVNWRKEDIESIDEFDGVALVTCHGAKGLEFDKVLLWDDFRFDELIKIGTKPLLSKPYYREMIDLVYVAVTRTKKQLFLSDGAQRYIQWREACEADAKKDTSPTAEHTVSVVDDLEYLSSLRTRMEKEWISFEKSNLPIGRIDDVPWPLGSESNPFCLDSSMTLEEQLRLVRIALLRYHPDKFFAQFSRRILLAVREDLKQKLHEVLLQARGLRERLRSSDLG